MLEAELGIYSIFMCVYTYVHIYLYMYICVCMYTHVNTRVCTCTHTIHCCSLRSPKTYSVIEVLGYKIFIEEQEL